MAVVHFTDMHRCPFQSVDRRAISSVETTCVCRNPSSVTDTITVETAATRPNCAVSLTSAAVFTRIAVVNVYNLQVAVYTKKSRTAALSIKSSSVNLVLLDLSDILKRVVYVTVTLYRVPTGKFMLQFGALFLWQANCCLMYGGSFWVA